MHPQRLMRSAAILEEWLTTKKGRVEGLCETRLPMRGPAIVPGSFSSPAGGD